MIKIAYLDFWQGFDGENDFFTAFLRTGLDGVEVVRPQYADVIVYSSFGSLHRRWLDSGKKLVFYTGENQRPRQESDFNLTFDPDGKRNRRLPIWWRYVNWLGGSPWSSGGWLMPKRLLTNPLESKKRDRFVCMVSSHVTPERKWLVDEISQYGRVDSWGLAFNTVGRFLKGTEFRKAMMLRRYVFNICPENTHHSGYVTEKALQAWASGCVPIYSGGYEGWDFNPRSLFDLKRLIHLNLHDVDTRSFFEQPLVDPIPTEEQIFEVVKNIIP